MAKITKFASFDDIFLFLASLTLLLLSLLLVLLLMVVVVMMIMMVMMMKMLLLIMMVMMMVLLLLMMMMMMVDMKMLATCSVTHSSSWTSRQTWFVKCGQCVTLV